MILIEQLSSWGAGVTAFIWLPLLVWTLLVVSVHFILRFCRNLHVQYHYHIRLALLLALPAGLLLAGLVDIVAGLLAAGSEIVSSLKFISVQTPVSISITGSGSPPMLLSPHLLHGTGLAIFFMGAVFHIFSYFRQYLQLSSLTRKLTLKPIGTEKRISRLNKDLAIECRKTIRVAYLEKPVVPVTYGVRKPVILLPAMLMMSCTDMQSEIQQDVLDEEINMQEVYNEEKDFYRVTEEMPELIGGLSGVQENLEYPEEALTAGLEGNVYVRFIINRRGEVEDATVIRGIGEGPDEAALKAVEQARFRPGRHKGETICVQYSLPINFKLNHRLK